MAHQGAFPGRVDLLQLEMGGIFFSHPNFTKKCAGSNLEHSFLASFGVDTI